MERIGFPSSCVSGGYSVTSVKHGEASEFVRVWMACVLGLMMGTTALTQEKRGVLAWLGSGS
jgi:hypothetical protein